MKIKKLVSLTLTAIMALSATAFAACGGGEDFTNDPTTWESLQSGETVKIVFAGRDVDSEKINYQNFLNEFNQTNEYGIVAELKWNNTQDYNIYLEGCGKNLPDVFMLSNERFIAYANAGKLADIKDYVDTSLLADLYKEGYEVYYFNPTTKKVGSSEGAALYGLPKDQGPVALCYNKDLLTEKVEAYNTANPSTPLDINKITSTTEPMKFSEFLEIGGKLKTVMQGKYVCSGYDLQSIVYSNNANFFTDNTATTSAITSENFIGAIKFIQDMYQTGILPAAGSLNDAEQEFENGNAIFYYAQPFKTKDYWTTCAAFNWDILPVLCGDADGAVSTAYVGGMCYAISANSKYKDAALKLVEFLSCDANSQRTQYKRGQCIPNLKSLSQEYATNSLNLIGTTSGGKTSPANRGVWIDVVDGYGSQKTVGGVTYTDKVAGKYCAESFTYKTDWYGKLVEYMGGDSSNYGSVWQGENVRTVLESYNDTFQAALDAMQRILNRN